MAIDQKTKRRFWEKVDVLVDESSCWEWTAGKFSNGYGALWLDGKMQKAHRGAWTLVNGSIPKGEGHHGTCVLHRCDNRACVRPDHLFLGSNADNVRDMTKKGRVARGEASGRSKLTSADVYAIRADTRLLREIAADYGISEGNVSLIKRRKRWAHLPEQAAK
jgi:hypothetical protein